ncbi:MAG TPA: CarD family transcriptional regulator [Aestuariivirga sp.]|jgi:CarD family transcriptional regulator|nr:CarD family transcriptional regulator [Aestuariivirga sp.]
MKKTVKKAALAKKAAHTKKSVAKAKVATKAKAVAAKAKSKVVKSKPKAKVVPVAKPVAKKTILTKVTGHLKSAKPVHVAPVPVAKPVAVAPKPVAVAPKPVATPAPVVAKPVVAAAPAAPKKLAFKIGEQVVYPAHGVGRITAIEEQEIAGSKLELYIVDFEREKLRLKVPTNRAEQKGMRRLADRGLIEHAMKVIRGRARIKRTMWSRRAQEYDAKINSGDLIAVAEVVRDLYRSDRQPEQSYSERQLFEQALLRMARELAAVRKVDDDQSVKELSEFLAKNAKRAQAAGEKAEEEAAAEEAA